MLKSGLLLIYLRLFVTAVMAAMRLLGHRLCQYSAGWEGTGHFAAETEQADNSPHGFLRHLQT